MARKITQDSVNAFMAGKPFSSSNMTVTIEPVSFATFKEDKVVLRLHGNAIAQRIVGSDEIEITNAGWASNTTKERLNALPGVSVVQRNFTWYLNGKEWDGEWTTV